MEVERFKHRQDPLPCPHTRTLEVEEKWGEKEELEAACGNTVHREDRSRPGKSRPRRRRARLLPLPPCPHAAVFFLLADEPRRPSSRTLALRPVATKVRTSFPVPFVDGPAFEPRGNATLAPRRRRR
jgi:hypothetical protein